MAQKILSFATTVHGVRLDAEVAVQPRGGGQVAEHQMEYARQLTEHLMDVTAEYQPEPDARNESMDAYVVLANTFQALDLARDSADALPSQIKEYLFQASSNLEVLAAWDPRFTAAEQLTRWAEELAGNFDTDSVVELVGSIETWMPQRYAGPGFTPRRVVVDDVQAAEDFAATRVPDHEAVQVQMLDDAALTPDTSSRTGRTVLPVPMFPDGTLDNRVVARAAVRDMVVVCTFETDREAFHLLRALADAATVYTSERRGATPLDFYTELAYAKQLCWLARTERFAADGMYRRKLIGELYPALITLSLFGPEFIMPKYLAKLAEELNEDLGGEEVITVVQSIEAWLPRDVNEYVPTGWHDGLDAQLPEPLLAGLNALPGARFVAVIDAQTQEEYAATGLPDKQKLNPVDLGGELDPDLIGSNAQLFRAWV